MAKTAKGTSQPDNSSVEGEQADKTPISAPTQDQIADRAYHIFLERGGVNGNPEDDWLQAERELSQAIE